MNVDKFSIGFWHPFGSHAGETRESILQRKAQEITSVGWTLWSFQYRNTLEKWFNLLLSSDTNNTVYVLCSDSPNASDPKSYVAYCRKYRNINKDNWLDIPTPILVPHPIGKRSFASSFVVGKIIYQIEHIKIIPELGIEWFSSSEELWRNDNLPTRGEYLIREGGKSHIRGVYAVLELTYPYLAILQK